MVLTFNVNCSANSGAVRPASRPTHTSSSRLDKLRPECSRRSSMRRRRVSMPGFSGSAASLQGRPGWMAVMCFSTMGSNSVEKSCSMLRSCAEKLSD